MGDQDPRTVRTAVRPTSPVEDRVLSPYTGWTRDHWTGLAESMLAAARRYGSANHALVHFPGAEGGYGHNVDGLEGFARTFLAAGFLAAGSGGTRLGPLEWYAEGFRCGPDPTLDPALRWVRPSEHDQAKVEACSLALILHLTRGDLWDNLDARTQEMTVDYLAEWINASYPKNNWVWFRLITEQFLKSVGGPWSADDQDEDLAFNESCYAGDGWYRDGAGRSFDYYDAWVFQVYPLLWCDMIPEDPAVVRMRPIFQQRLDSYLTDMVRLIGADGSMLAQGRSLIYRFAAASTLWMGALTDSPALSPGLVRRAASGIVSNFCSHDAPGPDGLLSMGWYGPWRQLAQSYSGPGSPYWASKGLLGLTLPAGHPVWTATEEPLPADGPDAVMALPVPGWITASTHPDGIVRVVNHGTDHDQPGSDKADSPLYAHFGYSTATFPLLDANAWTTPLDQSVCLVDAAGRASHRTGFEALGTHIVHAGSSSTAGPATHPVGVGASRSQSHWVDPDPVQFRHGSGYTGQSSPAADIVVFSLVRGPWEVRAVRLNQVSPQAQLLRVGGWAVTGQQFASASSSDTDAAFAWIEAGGVTSAIRAIGVPSTASIRFVPDASPLEGSSAVPYLDFPVREGVWALMLITLSGQVSPDDAGEMVRIAADIASVGTQAYAHVVWPDGIDTDCVVDLSRTPEPGQSGPGTPTVPSRTSRKGDKQ